MEAFFYRDGKKAIYRTREILTKHIDASFSNLHEQVRKKSTTPDAPNNHLLQLCQKANQCQQEICTTYIHRLFKSFIMEAIDLPRVLIESEIKNQMNGLYDDVRDLQAQRKAAKSRGESVAGQITEVLRKKFKHYVKSEATNILKKATAALKVAINKAIQQTMGTALTGSKNYKIDKVVFELHQTYKQAFANIGRASHASQNDIAVLKAISKASTQESKRINDLVSQVQEVVPRLKRVAEADLSSASKRAKGTETMPIKTEE